MGELSFHCWLENCCILFEKRKEINNRNILIWQIIVGVFPTIKVQGRYGDMEYDIGSKIKAVRIEKS